MPQSKVMKLSEAMRDELHRRKRAGEFTLDQLLDWIHDQDAEADVSRTGLGRYLAKYGKNLERIHEAQEIAARCVEKLGENPRGDVGRLLGQMLSTLALQTLNPMLDLDTPPDTKEVFFLSMALKNLASAEKTSVDRELKVREKLKAEIDKKLDDEKRKSGSKLDPLTFEKARELVRGLL